MSGKMAGADVRGNSLQVVPEDLSLACFGEQKLTKRSNRQGYRFFCAWILTRIYRDVKRIIVKLWQAPSGRSISRANLFQIASKSLLNNWIRFMINVSV